MTFTLPGIIGSIAGGIAGALVGPRVVPQLSVATASLTEYLGLPIAKRAEMEV